jgi:hypothetical protein
MTDDAKQSGVDGQSNRMAIGIALALPLGVALSLILDSWAMLGVGVALGAYDAWTSSRGASSGESARPGAGPGSDADHRRGRLVTQLVRERLCRRGGVQVSRASAR